MKKEIKDLAERKCVQRFLDFKNLENIYKNPKENEVDVFVKNKKDDILRFQIVKADGSHFGEISKNIAHNNNSNKIYERSNINGDTKNVYKKIIDTIKNKGDIYKEQGKDMSKIILLLDDIGNIPNFILNQIRSNHKELLINSGFKEIWYVGTKTNFQFL